MLRELSLVSYRDILFVYHPGNGTAGPLAHSVYRLLGEGVHSGTDRSSVKKARSASGQVDRLLDPVRSNADTNCPFRAAVGAPSLTLRLHPDT